jgi:hypothetical protein
MNAAQFGNFIAGYAAGYAVDPVAYGLVRAAGCFYGVIGSIFRQGGATPQWSQIPLQGDNWDSVVHIEGGNLEGVRDRLRKWKRGR